MTNFTDAFRNSLKHEIDSHAQHHAVAGWGNAQDVVSSLGFMLGALPRVRDTNDFVRLRKEGRDGYKIDYLAKLIKQFVRRGFAPNFKLQEFWERDDSKTTWRLALQDPEFYKRIENSIQACEDIVVAEMMAIFVCIDPKKQNKDEKLTEQSLKRLLQGTGAKIRILGKATGEILLRTGEFVDVDEATVPANEKSRTMDMRIDLPEGHRIFLTLKMTAQTGGSQEGISKEIEPLLEDFQRNTDDKTWFVALLDGEHWTETAAHRRLNALSGPRSIACTTRDMRQVIEHILA